MTSYKKIKNNGFTLIEILVAMSIMMIMLAITINMTKSLNDVVELENASKNVDLKIRTAKTRSIGALNDTNFGVHFETSRIVVFEGSTFDDLDPANEVFDMPNKIEIYDISFDGGGSDVIFDRLTGNTDYFGNISLRVIGDASKTRNIYINSNGQSSFSVFETSSGSVLSNARHVHFDLGWNIENSTKLIFRWYNSIDGLMLEKEIDATGYFNTGQTEFNWTGTINESGINQQITIKSWLDGSNNTVLDVIRHNTENNKLKIYFYKSGEKHIATYENTGTAVDVTLGLDGGIMTIQ